MSGGRPGSAPRRLGAAVALLSCLAGLAGPAAAAPRRVVIGYGSVSVSTVPAGIAAQRGFFAKHGVEADLRFIRGGSATVAALLSGQLQVAEVSITQIVGPVSRGADLTVVATLVDRMPYRLIAGRRVRTPQDLRNGRVGVVTLSGASYLATRLALRELGLDDKRDRISLVAIGTAPERVAALAAGSIDAAVVPPGIAARLPAAQYHTLVDLRAAKGAWLHTGLVMSRRFLAGEPGVAEGVLRAVAEGMAFALDPANADAVKATIRTFLRLDDPGAVEAAYRDVLDDLAWKPVPDMDGAAAVLRAMADLGPAEGASRLRPDDLVDATLMRRFDAEGWLDRLRPRR